MGCRELLWLRTGVERETPNAIDGGQGALSLPCSLFVGLLCDCLTDNFYPAT